MVEFQKLREFIIIRQSEMNNANCYALEAKAKFIYQSDQEEEYQFDGSHIVRTQKSMSMMSSKQPRPHKGTQMKKSNSFLLTNKVSAPAQAKGNIQSKDKSKTSKAGKKSLNVTEGCKRVAFNKSSLTKTSESISGTSCKSSKASKNRSSVNRDYLILDSGIYACQNIQEVNEKLICRNDQLYSHARFVKSTLKNQAKIQNYFLAFARYSNYERKIRVRLSGMTLPEKKNIYLLLKTTEKPVHSPEYSIQDLINQAYVKLEQKTSEVIIKSPQHAQQVSIWKNMQLYKLMEIQSCLKQSEATRETLPSSSQDIKQNQNRLNNFGHNFHKGNSVFSARNSHSQDQKFPQQFEIADKKQIQIRECLEQTHTLSKIGIQKFLQNLWDYFVDSGLINTLISKLKESYGPSKSDKVRAVRQLCNFQYLRFEENQILENQIFVSFCKQQNKRGSGLPQLQQKTAIIFQKAVFDAFSLQLHKFQTDFPWGCFHPLQNNSNNSAYLIDEQNAMLVWDECISQVIKRLLSSADTEEMRREIKKRDEQSLKQYVIQQCSVQEWHKLLPFSHRLSYEALLQKVEDELWMEVADQIASL